MRPIAVTLMSLVFSISAVTHLHAMNIGKPMDRSLLPFKYRISETIYDKQSGTSVSTPPEILREIERVFETWQSVEGVDLSFVSDGLYGPREIKRDVADGVIFISLDNEILKDKEGAPAGIAGQNYNEDGQVIGGVVNINTRLLDYFNDQKGSLYSVVLHEVGHILGLGHSPVSGSIMSYRRDPFQSMFPLDDQDAIRQLYPAADYRGGEIYVTATLENSPAKEVQLALIDTTSGIGRFNVTSEDGEASFTSIPAGEYILGATEITPTGPCFSKDRARGFLNTFYGAENGTNDPNEAYKISIDDDTEIAIDLPLVAGKKRYDCYYGSVRWLMDEPSSGYHTVSAIPSHYIVESGEEKYLAVGKDQSETFDSHRTDTSGGVESGTDLIPAGSEPGFSLEVVTGETPNKYVNAETKDFVYARLWIDQDAAKGPRVVYCVNGGEYAITAVAFYIIEELLKNPFKDFRNN